MKEFNEMLKIALAIPHCEYKERSFEFLMNQPETGGKPIYRFSFKLAIKHGPLVSKMFLN
jgi:hypothetical protein